MPLLRIKFLPNLNLWDEEELNPERLAEKWFDDPADEQPSLYLATTPTEEIEAVAAFSLTNLARGIEVGHLIRINWADLAELGIQANNARPGNTGIVAVDFRHWEIHGDRGPILKLLGHIGERARLGEDRFRWVGKQMQRAALKRFLELDSRLAIEEAKRCCQRKLEKRTGGKRPLGREIREELRATPPTIPRERINSRAGAIWLGRLGAGTPGNEEQDWLRAEQEVRLRYEQQLTGYTQPSTPGTSLD